MEKCSDCGVLPGNFHVPGCDMEKCPFCKCQLISCDCFNQWALEKYSEIWEEELKKKGLIPFKEQIEESAVKQIENVAAKIQEVKAKYGVE